MAQILDCIKHLDGQAVKNAGYHGAIRYLRKEGTSIVVPIDGDERRSLLAAGRSVAYVYQHVQSGGSYGSNSRVCQGRAAGQHDAQWALSQVPQGAGVRAIYGVTCDYDVPSTDFSKIIDYARGWCDVLGVLRVGVYGKDTVLQALKTAGVASWFWQTAAWSGGRVFAGRHLFQRVGYVNVGGVQCDVNDCSGADWGQEGADMAIDQADVDKICWGVKSQILQADNYRQFGDNRNPGDCLTEAARSSVAAAQGISQAHVKLDAITGTLATVVQHVTNDPDITADALQQMINTAIANAAPSIAASIAHQTTQALEPELVDLLSQDNEDEASTTASKVLDLISQRLAAAASNV